MKGGSPSSATSCGKLRGSGLAVAVGTKIVAVDLFDKVSTCRKVWDRLLTGYVLEALEAENTQIRTHKKHK